MRDVLDPEQLPFEPDEPEVEPDDDEVPMHPTTASSSVYDGDREWEFSTVNLTSAQVVDGQTLAGELTRVAAEGWQLAHVVDAGDDRVLVLRRPRKKDRERRQVGFAPPRAGQGT